MTKEFLIFYRNGTEIFSRLKSGCAREYLLWVFFARANWEGKFHHSSYEYGLFVEHLKRVGSHPYSRNTMDIGIGELKDSGLIIRLARGRYQINPLYLWAGTQVERKKALGDIPGQVSKENLVLD